MIRRKPKIKTLLDFNEKAFKIYGTSKITKEQAKDASLTFFWSGIPCVNGHLTWSYVSNGCCRQCNLERVAISNGHEKRTDKQLGSKRNILFEMEMKNIDKNIYDFEG